MTETRIDWSGSLKAKVAVVTGSSQGIGAGIAKMFAECGARVVIHGPARENAEAVAKGICSRGAEAIAVPGDLRQEAACRRLIQEACAQFGTIDILVNNAAIYPRGNIESTPIALWDEVMATNLRAPFILCQEAVKTMKERRSGCIINIGSVNAYVGARNLLAYSASKGGLMTFTRNLAHDLESFRVRANQINPGWVLTEGERQMQSVAEGKGENWLQSALPTRPFGRMLDPEDIARAALFFATNELITGAVLDCEQTVVGAPWG
jgi:NAD(P)-dependent dehydrogenase (short-subunit alcohol dehydrogenase family)